ncbi:MAG: hypothetical protein EPO32_09070 [Anaerolineae bacterium]|nr:MAG: hypothetical protein EPO32_09070 [Anaerolineae bacterium]
MKRTLLAVLLALALAALACTNLPALNGGNDSADSGAPPAPADSGAPAGSSGPGNPAALNLDDPTIYEEMLDVNYYIVMDFNFTVQNPDGTTLFRQVLLNGQRSATPPRSYFRFESNDPAVMGGLQFLEAADMEGTDYIYTPSVGCIVASNPDADNPYDTLADTGGFLKGESPRVESGVLINGVLTDRYQITMDNIDTLDGAGYDVTSLEEGSLYLAQSDGSLIRLLMRGRGTSVLLTNDATAEGDIHYQMDFTPTTDVFDIQPPADCADSGEFPYPLPPDATNVTVITGLSSFTTQMPFEDLLAFYKTEMAARGYTVSQEMLFAPTATLTFTSATESVNVIIAPGPTGTGSSVLITPAP